MIDGQVGAGADEAGDLVVWPETEKERADQKVQLSQRCYGKVEGTRILFPLASRYFGRGEFQNAERQGNEETELILNFHAL